MTENEFKRTQEFINSMFTNKEDVTIINSKGKTFLITYQDTYDKPITPVGVFTRAKKN